MSTRAERRRAEKAAKKWRNKKFSLEEVNEMVSRARMDTLELAVKIHDKVNVEESEETRKNQFHLLLERQVRMRMPTMNKLLDEGSPFIEREEKKQDDNREDGAAE